MENTIIKKLIDALRKNNPGNASDEELLGVALAKYFDWDSRIVEVAMYGMEASNIHWLAAPLFAAVAEWEKN